MTATLPVWVLATETVAEEPNPLLPHYSELIVGLIAFGLLFFFLRAKVFPVFERVYAERRDAIEGGMTRAASAEAQAQELLEQYRAQLQEARSEASRIRTEAQSERAGIVEAARLEAREVAQQEAERTRQQVHAELATARAELSREIGALAVDLAGRVVGENLADTAATRRTVDRFLDSLGDLAPAGGPAPARTS